MPVGESSAQRSSWSMPIATRIAAATVSVVWVLLAVVIAVRGGAPVSARVGICLAAGAIVLVVWRMFFVPSLVLHEHAVVVQNQFLRVTVPFTELEAARVGPRGLVLVRKDHTTVRVWALQNSPLMQAFGRRTRAETVARILTDAAVSGGPVA